MLPAIPRRQVSGRMTSGITLATCALAPVETLPAIGKLLGHTQVQTTARYAHLARDSIQTAAARITGSIGGNLSSAQVVDKPQGHKRA